MSTFLRFVAVLSVGALVACSGGTQNDDDDGTIIPRDAGPDPRDAGPDRDAGVTPDSGVVDAGVEPTPTWSEVQAVLTQRCAPCHAPGNRDRRIVVREYANIVGVESPVSRMNYVTPGDPQASWIYRKIEGTQIQVCRDNSLPTRNCGGLMPTNQGTALTATQIQMIEDWILGGAHED